MNIDLTTSYCHIKPFFSKYNDKMLYKMDLYMLNYFEKNKKTIISCNFSLNDKILCLNYC